MPTPDPNSSYLLQESGSGYFLLEDDSGFILLEAQGPIPPTPTPSPQGGGRGYGARKRRKYVKLRDGRQFEVENDQELQDVIQRIIAERETEAPPKKAKISRKIRQRPPKVSVVDQLQQINDWSVLYASFADLQMAVITEQVLLDLIRNTVLAELADEEDAEMVLWLM